MPNMGYCRFQNTVADLADCYDHMGDFQVDEDEVDNLMRDDGIDYDAAFAKLKEQILKSDEYKARSRLISICRRIVAEYDSNGE